MKDKEFDHIIREKLSELSGPVDPSGWGDIEAQLDAGPPVSDQEFDQAIYQKLHRYEANEASSGWEAFARNLELAQLPDRLLRLKVLELMVFLFLLLPFTTQDPAIQPARPAPSEPMNPIGAQSPAPLLTPGKTLSQLPDVPAPFLNPAAAGRSNPTINPGLEPWGEISRLASSDRILLPQKNALPTEIKSIPPAHMSSVDAVSSQGSSPGAIPLGRLDPISSGLQRLPQSSWPEIQDKQPAKRLRRPLILTIFSGFNFNKIVTPAQDNYEVPPIVRYHPGFEAGADLAVGLGKWEVLGGLKYTSYRYLPQQVLYLEGSLVDGVFGAGFKKIELSALSLSAGVRYPLLTAPRWSVSVGAGLQFNTIFDVHRQVAELDAFIQESPVRDLPRRQSLDTKPAAIEGKNYSNGWLEGGPFSENNFLSADLNLTGELFLNPTWSLFSQLSYQPFLPIRRQGVGPDRDRIHTLGLKAGLRIRFMR
jgi:hypothetical protein